MYALSLSKAARLMYWNIAQSVEQWTVNPSVASSSLAIPAKSHLTGIEAREVKCLRTPAKDLNG